MLRCKSEEHAFYEHPNNRSYREIRIISTAKGNLTLFFKHLKKGNLEIHRTSQ